MTEERFPRRDILRGAAAAGFALVSATGIVAEVDAVGLSGVTGTVTSGSGLNLRIGPNAAQPVITWLPNGTPLTIRGTSADWFKVTALGRSGWVNSWYVTLRGTKSTEIRRGNTYAKRVALTFDCGSDYGYAGQILSILAHHGVPASFGLTGAWMDANPDAAARIGAGGYQLINHTLSHPSYTGLSTGTGAASPAKRLAQIQANENRITALTGRSSKPYWRPPYGDIDAGVLRDAGALGYGKTAMWTIDYLGGTG